MGGVMGRIVIEDLPNPEASSQVLGNGTPDAGLQVDRRRDVHTSDDRTTRVAEFSTHEPVASHGSVPAETNQAAPPSTGSSATVTMPAAVKSDSAHALLNDLAVLELFGNAATEDSPAAATRNQ